MRWLLTAALAYSALLATIDHHPTHYFLPLVALTGVMVVVAAHAVRSPLLRTAIPAVTLAAGSPSCSPETWAFSPLKTWWKRSMQPSTLTPAAGSSPLRLRLVGRVWAWLRAMRCFAMGTSHVGAAELFRADLLQGDVAGFVERLWVGPWAYPQMFAAMVGGWWWLTGLGDPAHPVVRSICLVSLPVAALATGRIAARLRRRASPSGRRLGDAHGADGAVGQRPHPPLHAREFGDAVTAVAVLSALRWADYPSLGRSIEANLFLAAALPAAWAVRERLTSRGMLAAVAAVATAIAAPWLAVNLGPHAAYAGASVAGHGSSVGLDHLAFYPRSVLWVGLGPVLTAAAVWAFVRGRQPGFAVAAIWLLGGLLVLMVIPKSIPA